MMFNNSINDDMEPVPPPLLLEEQQQDEAADLDSHFGNMLCKLMDGQLTAADAISQLAQRSGDVVKHYRSEAADELNAAAYRLNMSHLADELEAQAASWQLLQALYCTDGLPAGNYKQAPSVGGRLTMRQLLADTVNMDNGLRRFAQVVMWLEGLASQKLPQTHEELQATCRFSAKDGVWRDTLRVTASSGQSVCELDPDAVSRDQLKLALGDAQNDQRLAAWVWRLVRAGKFKDACELCAKAGQSWRAVSLAGAGPWGPLPVGDAATQAAAQPPEGDAQDASEEVACEVEGGAASARLAWRWACCAAAAAAGPSEDGGASGGGGVSSSSSNRFEAALYGALCGDVRSMLPACDSWEDEAWAYSRAWLELQTDAQLLQDCQQGGGGSSNPAAAADPASQAAAQAFFLGAPAAGELEQQALEVPLDVLEGLVDVAAASGYSSRRRTGTTNSNSSSRAVLREGLGVMQGDWPLTRLALCGGHLCVPSTFRELYELLATSSNSSVSAAAQHSMHILQLQLMSEDWVGLVSHLNATSSKAAAALQRLQQQQQGKAQGQGQYPSSFPDADVAMGYDDDDSAAAAGGVDDDDDGVSVSAGAAGRGAGGSSSSSGVPPQGLVDVLRFNAHMALSLRALGRLGDPSAPLLSAQEGEEGMEEGDEGPSRQQAEADRETLHMLQQVLSQVICAYASHLASQPSALNLVPAYLCHLRLPERRQLAAQLLATALDMGLDDVQGEFLIKLLSQGTEFWYGHQLRARQQQLEAAEAAAEAPPHLLFGDLRPEEARLLLQHNVYRCFSDAASSPRQRCDQLRWMVYGFIAALHEQQQQQQDSEDGGQDGGNSPQQPQQQQLYWQGCWADAASNSLGLATQLALNPGFGGPGLAYLMQEVIPQEFPAAAQEAAADAAAAVAAAAGDDGAAAAVAVEFDSAVSSAAGVNVVQPAGQLQVQRQLLALGFWQAYAQVEGQYQQWKQSRREQLGAAAAAAEAPALSLQDAVGLVQGMLGLAEADALRLQAPQQLAQLLASMARASASSAAGAEQQQQQSPSSVAEGDWLCMPQFDAPVNPLVLAACAEGTVEQVLGLLPYCELQLALTLQGSGGGEGGDEEGARDIGLPYRRLERHELPELQARVDAFLQAAAAACPDVSCVTGVPGSDEPLSGCLLVKLSCYSRGSTAGSSSGRALDSRELQAWQDLVGLVVALMDAGSKQGAAADDDDGEEQQGEAEGGVLLPRLCVVYLNSSLSTQLAISRRRTTSKLLRRSAKVLSVLTRQGYRGPEVDTLLSLASQGGGDDDAGGLLGQLSQADAAALLDRLTDVLAEVQDGA